MRRVKDQQYCFSLYNGLLEANWKVLLSNDEIIYQDDYNNSSWLDLKIYCKENKVWPIHLTLEYYDNILNILPPNADGYFFRRGILTELTCSAYPSESMPFQGNRSKTAIIGYLDNGLLYTTTVRLPELAIWDSQIRDDKKMSIDRINEDNSLIKVSDCIQVNTQIERSVLHNI